MNQAEMTVTSDAGKSPSEELLEQIGELVGDINQLKRSEFQNILEAFDGKAKGFELSHDEIAVLQLIAASEPAPPLRTIVDILAKAKNELVHPSTISSMIGRLQAQGLIDCSEKNPVDKRQQLHKLTPEGKALSRQLKEAETVVLKNVVDALHLDDTLIADLKQRVFCAQDRLRSRTRMKPSVAGVYDFLLGGFSFAHADRKFVEDLKKANPNHRFGALENRAFLRRAVHWMAKQQGIRQFIDIGSGFPTNCNTHHVAHKIDTNTAVAYVDNDPEVVRTSSSLLRSTNNVCAVQNDLRCIDRWLCGSRFANIDLAKPVGVLLVAVCHFISDDTELQRIFSFLKNNLRKGSFIAISHATVNPRNTDVMKKLTSTYSRQVSTITLRSREVLEGLLDRFEIVDGRIGMISEWKPNLEDSPGGQHIDPKDANLLACVVKV